MIKMIVGRGRNDVIGSEGALPWRLRNDMKFFRETTEGNTVVMGRKTFESIGRPLPNRRNVVITRNEEYTADGIVVIHSPRKALELPPWGDLIVIGGQQIYEAFLPYANEILLTEVDVELPGDTFFHDPEGDWEKIKLQEHDADAYNDYRHVIYKLRRKTQSYELK